MGIRRASGGRRAFVLDAKLLVVGVNEGRECCAEDDAERKGDEHEASNAGAVAFTFLVYYGVSVGKEGLVM